MADPFGLLGTGGFGGGGFGAPPGGAGGGGGMPGAGGQVPSNMADMQRQMMQNPGAMQQMMNSPMMQSLLENPELLRTLMMANPQVRELMERNPELAGVLNDPATMRQTMQAARNPDLMNEMVRNTDRQMANIEAMPGGFDALRRMYENVQAPLMDATTPLLWRWEARSAVAFCRCGWVGAPSGLFCRRSRGRSIACPRPRRCFVLFCFCLPPSVPFFSPGGFLFT